MIVEGAGLGILAKMWTGLAAFIGAATGAYFIRPRTKLEWLLVVLGGFFASVFVGPLAVGWLLPGAAGSDSRVAAIYYLFGLLAMVCIPAALRGGARWVEKRAEQGPTL